MSDPATLEEYNAKFKRNQKLTGYGFETTSHFPCPACCEADWMICRVVDTKEKLIEGAQCKACGRGFKAEFADTPGSIQFEVVQTTGPDMPAYIPKMKRVGQ